MALCRQERRLIDNLLNVAGSRIIVAAQERSQVIVADVGQQLRFARRRHADGQRARLVGDRGASTRALRFAARAILGVQPLIQAIRAA